MAHTGHISVENSGEYVLPLDALNPLWLASMCAMFSAESPVGKAVLDKDLRYVFINQTLADFNG